LRAVRESGPRLARTASNDLNTDGRQIALGNSETTIARDAGNPEIAVAQAKPVCVAGRTVVSLAPLTKRSAKLKNCNLRVEAWRNGPGTRFG